MPIMNGIDATTEIRSFLTQKMKLPLSHQPFILGVTGNVAPDLFQLATEAGMNEILSKPVYFKELKQILAKHMID